jgi:atlastin
MKVGIIAVVGAFRTGKSFLLNFFLRYLRTDPKDLSQKWMVSEGEELLEGNLNEGGWSLVSPVKDGEEKKEESATPGEEKGEKEKESQQPTVSAKSRSFQWRGGQKRQTTGIWMWSEPFIRATSTTNGEKIAILLMDTQGMFDNETTMTLTAQIFGLSTLVSSFQVYNVCRQIQEDNLQHLALFSEYGRMALLPKVRKRIVFLTLL